MVKAKIENGLGIVVLYRVRFIGVKESKFEWTFGEANGIFPDESFVLVVGRSQPNCN
jgi:hypothetical protein